jgi:hypothetical protein
MTTHLGTTLALVLRGLALLVLSALPAAAEGRVALVIGNEAYEHAPPLQTPVRDAQDVARGLRELNFDVTVLTDAGPDVFEAVLSTFAAKAAGADTVLFYYSGHAFQTGGVNRLVPVSAALDDAAALESQTLALDDIARRLKPAAGQLLIFLDACRTNPLPEDMGGSPAGLAQYDGGTGTFVAFATAPGQVAWDKGADGANSPFTGALLRHIAEPGQTLSDLMIAVRNEVSDETGGKQVPWEQSSLRSQFLFRPAVNQQPGTGASVSTGGDLPEFETVDASSFLLDDGLVGNGDGSAAPVASAAPVRIAALSSQTRSLTTISATPSAAPRIAGNDPTPGGVTVPEDLASGVQEQLKRVGCYGKKVDGQWGDGSRGALRRYFEAIKADVPDTLEPTAELYLALTEAKEATCKPEPVAARPKATAKTSGGTKPKAAAPAKKSDPAPAQKEKTGPKCKFLVVAVVCS